MATTNEMTTVAQNESTPTQHEMFVARWQLTEDELNSARLELSTRESNKVKRNVHFGPYRKAPILSQGSWLSLRKENDPLYMPLSPRIKSLSSLPKPCIFPFARNDVARVRERPDNE